MEMHELNIAANVMFDFLIIIFVMYLEFPHVIALWVKF